MNKDLIVKLLCELISIPSVNPNLSGKKDANEMEIAIFVKDWLVRHGIKAHIDEVEPSRPNVYGEIGNGEGPTLCLCAHLDTVGVEEMTIDPFIPHIEKNRVYGRGSCDMKGGLAAVMSAAATLAEKDIPGKLILALVCDEEYASIGAEDFVKKYTADACILTEPSDLQIVLSHKGFLWGKVTTFGKSAHGSAWQIGQSAIAKMGPVITALDDFEKNVLRKREDPLVGPASMHASLVQGGTGVSTYASSCELHIERRTLPLEKMGEIQDELENVIAKGCPDAEVEWYFQRPPFSCGIDEPIFECVQRGSHKVLNKDPSIVGWGVWTDAAIFQNAGIPTVNIGPKGFGLHEPVEWVEIDSVVQTASILYQAANNFFDR